jgi:hypothetical protein
MPLTFFQPRGTTTVHPRPMGIIDWARHFPWWRPVSKVRILIYADDTGRFSGGSFLGLQYVYNLLKSLAYFYVDFQIEFADRDGSETIAGGLAGTGPFLSRNC